ncbi:ABC transporter ATP-binding protein [Microbaculum marinum]|uniref:ABC transporter ATP-binding protein n=1 Tax=Microbaculum marinum TaxID=1764581 RepID=A0AAW9RIL6_9HYPH
MTLVVDRVTSGYGDRSVVAEISFTIEPGRIMALFGHNGAGKSTILKSLLGLIPVSSGTITLDGHNLERLPVTERVEHGLRLLPEGRGVFPELTVEENLAVVSAANPGRDGGAITASQVLELFPALAERRQALAGNMSGGQQQMLALGLAIIGSPRCLLLEEPSVGLQPDLVEHLFAQISRICRELGVSAILIEHKIASAMKIVDDVLIINTGEVVFYGSNEETRRTDIWKFF